MQHITKIYRSKKIHRVEKVTQTGKYKLNLIEPTDPFLPEALNQNTQKIEDAMTAHEEGIEQRLTVLEARKFAYGTYRGNYNYNSGVLQQLIQLPFAPKAAFVKIAGVSNSDTSALSTDLNSPGSNYLTLTEDGFLVSGNINQAEVRFNYIAFG